MQPSSKSQRGPVAETAVRSSPVPWALAAVVFAALTAIGYSLDSDRSLSERNGVVTRTEAENDVIPSLPPD